MKTTKIWDCDECEKNQVFELNICHFYLLNGEKRDCIESDKSQGNLF